ncbi:MAG: glycoside hydrolase family 27 protein [Draconibacterium sp.]
MRSVIILLLVISFNTYSQNEKSLAASPPMGWNSWNWFGKHAITEANMRECMDAVVEEGLLEAGYEYFVIDGGWRDTRLGENGELLPNPERFPQGIKALADYAHSKGLKFGLHTVPGTHDCGGDPVGGFGIEEIHVQQFADWGVDLIKLDKCRHSDGWNEELLQHTYEKWHNLIEEQGKDIVLSISAYKWRDWYPEVGQMARTTGDIEAKVTGGAKFDGTKTHKYAHSVMQIAEVNDQWASFAGNGYWNDPDMLVTGEQGLTEEEQKAQFALWCIMSSPLMLGNDPRSMKSSEKEIITNKLAIAINQDPTEQGRRIIKDGNVEVWMKKLKDNSRAVLLLNRDPETSKNIKVTLKELGLSGERQFTDIYKKKKLGKITKSFSRKVQPRSGLFIIIS